MRILLLTIVLLSTRAFSQSPALPVWNTKEINFSCTEMKVKDENTGKIIFDGLKDSHLKLSDKAGAVIDAVVSVKMADYFEIKEGLVTKCEFEIKKDSKSITYTVFKDTKLCVIIISYGLDKNKPAFIVISTNDNWKEKTPAKLTFTLDGFK